jgi:hypothetical protein
MNELHNVNIRDKRILNPKNTQTFEKRKESKERKGFMKVEGDVHRKKYDGYCTKQ